MHEGFRDRDVILLRKRGDLKIQQLLWFANIIRIMPLGARQYEKLKENQ